jgi:multicomponent Na+:H+ antiporter subunit C
MNGASGMPYLVAGVVLVAIGLHALVVHRHVLRLVIGLNVIGAGAFLLLIAPGVQSGMPDPVPHALVLTGIVVSVATSGLAVAIARAIHRETGASELMDDA